MRREVLAVSFWLTDNKDEINEYVFEGGLSASRVGSYDDGVIAALVIPEFPDESCPPGYEWELIILDNPPSGELEFRPE